ncbi:SapC family protein [Novosphingobium sp.]|uniref:SapC family protein n=1 Tax=Novosphingobium sp. TaxID=1874826 RepID=UPI0038BC00C2
MTDFVSLDFAQHKLLRLANRHGAELGDALGMVGAVPTEIPALAASYPLFFRKAPGSGRFELAAMLGFTATQNLFLDGERWDAGYVPLALRCEPFAVGQSAATPDRNTLLIDLDSPRLTRSDGDVLFFSDGRPSERLQAIVDALEALVTGAQVGRDYATALETLDLIEPVDVRVEADDGPPLTLSGLYTIAQDRLNALPDAALLDLRARGFLPWIYQQAASVGQIANLIVRRDRIRATLRASHGA